MAFLVGACSVMPTVKGNINNGSNRFAIGTAGKEMQVFLARRYIGR